MSNYIEYNDKIAFHPGYYIKEIIEESGLSQKDFAKRLDTTPKNLSILVRGEQSLSIDIYNLRSSTVIHDRWPYFFIHFGRKEHSCNSLKAPIE